MPSLPLVAAPFLLLLPVLGGDPQVIVWRLLRALAGPWLGWNGTGPDFELGWPAPLRPQAYPTHRRALFLEIQWKSC